MQKISIKDSIYPKCLRNIPNSPIMLYVEGNIDLLKSESIAIIGSRIASLNGKLLAEKFATELSSVGITIISGLAQGIDSIAHSFSYNKKGKTIAVLGTGINNIYPKNNIGLLNNILDNGGLVISEYSPNEKKQPEHFRNRNRIISGLSLGVIVIEAKRKSGTSITAKFAQEQGRPVFVLPHEIWDLHGVGTNRLLKNGSIPITDTEDVLNGLHLNNYKEIYLKLKKQHTFNEFEERLKNIQNISNSTKNKLVLASTPLIENNTINLKFSTPQHEKIYSLIQDTPITINEIARLTQYPINEILSVLFKLEMDGYIKKMAGNYLRV